MTAYRFRFSKTRNLVLSAMLLGALALADTPALAQGSDMQILLDRMERLERDIRTLNRQIARGPGESGPENAAPTGASATPSGAEFTPGEGALSRVTVRISGLEQEVRQATGQNEALSYKIDQISARLDTLITDLDYRLARLEGSAPGSFSSQPSISTAPSSASVSKVGEMAAPTNTTETMPRGTLGANGTYVPPVSSGSLGRISKTTLDQFVKPENADAQAQGGQAQGDQAQGDQAQTAPVESTAPAAPATSQTAMAAQQSAPVQEPAPEPVPEPVVASILPEGTPRERYQFAFGLMSQARYDDAEAALKEFITKHGDDPLAANARYWLGETYYVRKSFMDAAQAFFQAYKSTPEGGKAADSLLKLGMSMASLEKTEEACATFGKLRKEFIDLKPGIEKTLNRETKRLKCQ